MPIALRRLFVCMCASLAVGCGVDVQGTGPAGDVQEVVASTSPTRADPPEAESRATSSSVEAEEASTHTEPPPVERSCWASDVILTGGACQSAHRHLTAAFDACWSRGGEAADFEVIDACDGGGFARAKVRCCAAHPAATAPPSEIPEPTLNDLLKPTCTGTTPSGLGACSGPIAPEIAKLATLFASEGWELRSYHATKPCAPGGYSELALGMCTSTR